MTEIKISELSIGDWVRVINQFDAQIDGYHSESGSLSLKTRQGHLVYYRLEDIHPISLTPEILEKNGCLHTAENRILCDWFDGRITVRKYNNREWYELFVGSNQMKFKLMFVHQLQHALRLGGVEKEIVI